MVISNSSRSFKVMSFKLQEDAVLSNVKLPSGHITARLDVEQNVYNFYNFEADKSGMFHEHFLGSTPVMAAKTMFKEIQGTKYRENEEASEV